MCKFCDSLYSEKQASYKLHNEGDADLENACDTLNDYEKLRYKVKKSKEV